MADISDAKAYLQQLDPEVSYSCQSLTGGVVNVTIRAVKQSEYVEKGRFPGRASLVLKHAPPFVAGRGVAAPMTQHRQIIEADALSLFATCLSQVKQAACVSVPDILHHDSRTHVLVIADLGQIPNLSDIFTDLGGHSIRYQADLFSHALFASIGLSLSPESANFFEDVGSRLGQFFAHLHSPDARRKVLEQHSQSHFEVPAIRNTVVELAIRPLSSQLNLFPDLITPEEADTLAGLVLEDFLRETPESEQSFTLGDCWPTAVLVSPPSMSLQPNTVGVIDWEFASFARGPHGDIAQFLAHLELLRIVALQHPKFTSHLQALDLLIKSLIDNYYETATVKNTETTYLRSHHPAAPDHSSQRSQILRSAFLTHGAELVSGTFWKTWTCLFPSCPSLRTQNGQHAETEHTCVLVRSMVERGIWFLRHARSDVELFCGELSWGDIVEESTKIRAEGRRWVVDSF